MSFIRIPLVEPKQSTAKTIKKVTPGGNRQLKPSGCPPGSQQLDKSSLQPREQPPKNSKNKQNAACHSDRA
jgi:hypothetical protein